MFFFLVNSKCGQCNKYYKQSRAQENTEPELTIWTTIYTRKISTIRQPLRGTNSTSWNKAYLTAKEYMVYTVPIEYGGVIHKPFKDQVFIGGHGNIIFNLCTLLLKIIDYNYSSQSVDI